MMEIAAFQNSLWGNVAIFAVCTLVIGVLGTRLTHIADQLADRTGVGEALVGGVLLGAVTSLSGSVLSVSAAWNGMPELALSNAFGGMAAQMAFLAVADICYRKANLEHAAASPENMLQGALLVCVLAMVLMASFGPEWSFFGVHPATPLMVATYAYGMYLVRKSRKTPMWKPKETSETRTDVPEERNQRMSLGRLLFRFSTYALALGVAGWLLQRSAAVIVDNSPLNEAVMGALFTSVATSLPELVTSIAAVRRGALTLAVSGIIGGNAYDTLFAAFSDVAYRPGSIYHTMTPTLSFWIAANLLMSGVLIMGQLFRQRRGIGNIGFESAAVLAIYAVSSYVLLATNL
ncbi:hypothetical protein [Pelagicoccus sp. SDUM812003]|uniref:sodium:calcium antiporter n=1 Tax=Pelagicoccus sp. SDUM812003 TaxID=3041267 RepID=UPI00280DF88E|nr:hypothetical protein [Pelagicoccus sp. SDUM812003]MDQ8203833.1 hypothetical protein [Pelagicoccus sp. SDUM812003]